MYKFWFNQLECTHYIGHYSSHSFKSRSFYHLFFSLIIFIEGSAKQPQITDLKKNQIVKNNRCKNQPWLQMTNKNFKYWNYIQLIFYGPHINIFLPKEMIVYQGFYQSILVIDQFSNFHSLVLTRKHDCCLWLWCQKQIEMCNRLA